MRVYVTPATDGGLDCCGYVVTDIMAQCRAANEAMQRMALDLDLARSSIAFTSAANVSLAHARAALPVTEGRRMTTTERASLEAAHAEIAAMKARDVQRTESIHALVSSVEKILGQIGVGTIEQAVRRDVDRVTALIDGPPPYPSIPARLATLETRAALPAPAPRPGLNLPSPDDIGRYGVALRKWGPKSLIIFGLVLAYQFYSCDTERALDGYYRREARQDSLFEARAIRERAQIQAGVDSLAVTTDSLAEEIP